MGVPEITTLSPSLDSGSSLSEARGAILRALSHHSTNQTSGILIGTTSTCKDPPHLPHLTPQTLPWPPELARATFASPHKLHNREPNSGSHTAAPSSSF